MKSLNQVQLIGNLGNDPIVKECEGKIMAKFTLATSQEWLDKNTNERRINTEWHRLVCFNQVAILPSNCSD